MIVFESIWIGSPYNPVFYFILKGSGNFPQNAKNIYWLLDVQVWNSGEIWQM